MLATLTPRSNSPVLLSFTGVGKGYRDGSRETLVLEDVSFELRAGASMGLYAERRSGKSTLLRLAAALEVPDRGTVRFAGRDLRHLGRGERARLLRGPLALLSAESWTASAGETVIDHVAIAAGSSGLSLRDARRRALAALDHAEVAGALVHEPAASLCSADRARVMLARALVHEPRLLLVDEPTPVPSLLERDTLCALLRSLTRERGIAMLMTSEELATLQGLDVLASLSGGELCSTEQSGAVVELSHRRAAVPKRP